VKTIPADLAQHVCSVGIDVSATERLAAVYHRSLARRAARRLDEQLQPEVEELVRRTRRLAPATVYSLYKNTNADVGFDDITQQLQNGSTTSPTTVYRGASDERWLCDGLQEALRSLGWGEERVGTVQTSLPAEVDRSLLLARQAVSLAWPQAWSEHNTLVQYLVFVKGPVRSATVQSTFGVIYAEVQEASDPLRMFELLLHESAHHALSLREQFARFLDNPEDLGTHALRSDPRPLRGVLHAAFVMCRLAEGLSRYQRSHPSGGPLDGCPVQVRRDFARQSLREALTVLDETAQWTKDGKVLRANMAVWADAEGAST
jgi:hypothetical protein